LLKVKPRRKLPILVRDVMVTPPITAPQDTSISKAANIMYENGIGSLLIVDSENKLVGIVTERDMLYALAKESENLNKPVWRIMTENPITAKPEEPLVEALKRMRDAAVRHLPIVDREGKPIGIISMRDLVDALVTLISILGAL